MWGSIVLSIAMAMGVAGQSNERELVREHRPDGTLESEREVLRDEQGRLVNDGKYTLYHPDGSVELQGFHVAGERHRVWESWYPGGGARSKGKYQHGLRTGKWTYRHEDGSIDPSRSGEYAIAETKRADGTLRSRGETRDALRHGRWRFFWPNGSTQAEGEFENDWLQGEWRFWHAEGTLDPDWISGIYRDSVWTAPLPDASRVAQTPIELERLPVLAEPEPTSRARWLNGLRKNDPIDAARLAEAAKCVAALEGAAMLEGFGLPCGWRDSAAPEDVERNRLTILRLFSLHALMEESHEAFWIDHVSGRCAAASGARGQLFDFHPELLHGWESSGVAALFPYGMRGVASNGKVSAGKKASDERAVLQAAIEDALSWLGAHQERDGSWDCNEFSRHDPSDDRCDGPGRPEHDVGVTALAALAYLGNGSTTRAGAHCEPLSRAIGWLIRQQDPKSGRVGPTLSSLHDHAVATLALCEAAAFSKSEVLRASARRAIELVHRARNPHGAWHYEVPPVGENDTFSTGWMIAALKAGELAGIEVDRQAYSDALAWIDQATDPTTGRVGYNSVGSYSARVPTVNDRYPVDKTEGLTAVGLFCRLFGGQSSPDAAIAVRHADLMLRALPEWDRDGLTNDLYYWYYGSLTMFQMGGKYWHAWNKAVSTALLDSQRKDGSHRGSWDSNDPWGFASGRVGTTAIAALTLEGSFRFEPLRGR